MAQDSALWWRDGVLYQIYTRSFRDSNGDGVGDLRGVIEKLDYLAWLDVDGIWLTPITPSPDADWGYDVSDFKAVHPDFGTLADAERLMEEAAHRGIRVILDIVPNHTSDRHPWFRDALSSREAKHRDWYVWADAKSDGSPPNNWISVFGGGSAWEWHEPTGQYYLHNFLPQQPDLNWWNEEVRAAFDDILRFWFDKGVAGFRIDVAHALVKDRELRDNRAVTERDDPHFRRLGQFPEFNMNRPEGHEVLKRWRHLCDGYDPPRVLVGETWVLDLEAMAAFYGQDDELNLAFNFPFLFAPFDAKALRDVAEESLRLIPPDSWPVWTGSNHDVGRLASRWCGGDDRRIRCVLMMLLTMRGTPFLYYGDEIGLLDVDLPFERIRDPVGLRSWPEDPGRDRGRTPMHWTDADGAGFTSAGIEPWLPVGDHRAVNVDDQRTDPASVLSLTRDLIALRKRSPGLTRGSYRSLPAPRHVWAWTRGDEWTVVLNLGEDEATVGGAAGAIELHSTRARDGERVSNGIRLGAWEGAIVRSVG